MVDLDNARKSTVVFKRRIANMKFKSVANNTALNVGSFTFFSRRKYADLWF